MSKNDKTNENKRKSIEIYETDPSEKFKVSLNV